MATTTTNTSSSPPPPPPPLPPPRLPPPPPPPKQQQPQQKSGESGNDSSLGVVLVNAKQRSPSSNITAPPPPPPPSLLPPPATSAKVLSRVMGGRETDDGTGNTEMALRKPDMGSNGVSPEKGKTPVHCERGVSSPLRAACVEWRLCEEAEARRMLETLEQSERVHLELSSQTRCMKLQVESLLQSELFTVRLSEVSREEAHRRGITELEESVALQRIVLVHQLHRQRAPPIEGMRSSALSGGDRLLLLHDGAHSVLRNLKLVERGVSDSGADTCRHLSLRGDLSDHLERLQQTLREEHVLRELIEEHQLSIRRYIVSLCVCVFLSPFKLVHQLVQGGKGCGSVSPSRVPDADFAAHVPHEEAERMAQGRDLLYFFTEIGYDYQTASMYAALFLQHGFAVGLDMYASSCQNKQRIHEVLRKITKEDLSRIGISSVGEQTTLLFRLHSALRETEGCLAPPAVVVGNLHSLDIPIAGQPPLHFTPSTLMAFRAVCRRRMQHFDRLAQSRWDELRAASKFNCDDEWQVRWWNAVREDWHVETLWERQMDRLMALRKGSGVMALSALPLPYVTDSATARGQLLREKQNSSNPSVSLSSFLV